MSNSSHNTETFRIRRAPRATAAGCWCCHFISIDEISQAPFAFPEERHFQAVFRNKALPQMPVTEEVQSFYLSPLKPARNMLTDPPYSTLTCSPGFVQSCPLCPSCPCALSGAGTLAWAAAWGHGWCVLCLSASPCSWTSSPQKTECKEGVNVFICCSVDQGASSSCPSWFGMWPRCAHRPTNLKAFLRPLKLTQPLCSHLDNFCISCSSAWSHVPQPDTHRVCPVPSPARAQPTPGLLSLYRHCTRYSFWSTCSRRSPLQLYQNPTG